MRERGNFSPKILENPALLGESNLTRECEYRCEPKRHSGREGGQGEWKRKLGQKCVIPLLSVHRGGTAMTSTKETVGGGGKWAPHACSPDMLPGQRVGLRVLQSYSRVTKPQIKFKEPHIRSAKAQ